MALMSETAIQTTKPNEPLGPPPGALTPSVPNRSIRHYWQWLRKSLQVAASLRITVVLFALAILLIFFGTLAQVDEGIWTVVSKYFRCFLAWIPLKIFFPRDGREVAGSFPFPGGWLIAGLLLANLLAAHAVRFRLTWKRAGVLVLHAGLIVMIAGEFVTGLLAVEGQMPIVEGKSADYIVESRYFELAILRHIDENDDDVVVVPVSLVRKQHTIHNDQLPFDIQVEKYWPNSAEPWLAGKGDENPATAGDGLHWITKEVPETNGVESDKEDMPTAYVTFLDRDSGKSLGTYLVTRWWSAPYGELQAVQVGGWSYEIDLRLKRVYKPYSIHLDKFTHEIHPHSEKPRNYASRVRLDDRERNVQRETTISMNAPMRYEGETMYQSGVLSGGRGTILQVVYNPGAQLPYVSCFLVAVGMLVHFGIQLVEFLRRRLAA